MCRHRLSAKMIRSVVIRIVKVSFLLFVFMFLKANTYSSISFVYGQYIVVIILMYLSLFVKNKKY